MCKKLEEFQTLTKQRQESFDLQTIKLKSQIEKIDQEISGLLDKVTQANDSVMEYINSRVAALDAEKKELYAEVVRLTDSGGKNLEEITNYLDYWDTLTISDRITVVDSLIESIYASQEEIKINWKI